MVTINNKISDWIEEYERATQTLGEDSDFDDIEAMQALICRDSLEDHWAILSGEQRQDILTTDEKLAMKHAIVASELPPNPRHTDRSRWWWFLAEGPQVREEAEKLRREAVA